MGGTVGFTLREENGDEHRMSRHTNWTPWAIDNIGLVNKVPAHIDAILKAWREAMVLPKEKWHWSYSSPFLAPSEYGLIVVDLMKNKLFDCNKYHAFGRQSLSELYNEYNSTIGSGGGYTMPGNDGLKAFTEDKGNSASRFYKFYLEKRIKRLELWDSELGQMLDRGVDVNNLSPTELMDLINDEKTRYGHFILDMSPLEVTTFENSEEGWCAFRQAVLDLGFVLTQEEEDMWEEQIKEFSE